MTTGAKGSVSVGRWMWLLFVAAIPIIGVIATIYWLFKDRNESTRNFFIAKVLWFVIGVCFMAGLTTLGYKDKIENWINTQIQQYAKDHQPVQKQKLDRRTIY